MSDLIERQHAIDLVTDVCDAVMSGCESWYDPETGDEVYKDVREVDAILKCNKEVRIALRNMPSAQPEPSQVARDIATIIENEKDMRVIASADSPMIKPICPFRVERIESHTKVDEFTDKFVPCMRKRCPCYMVEADTEWCYREYLMFPLNEKAREIVDDFNNHKIY